MPLTDEQRRIVEASIDGPSVVDAGAGTGKTYTLVQRALALVASGELRASQLLVVTFMKKAATEIGERLTVEFAKTSEISVSDLPMVATFHGLAGALVREFAYECGVSPDLHSIDDLRARSIFARAYDDLIEGRLNVDLREFPLLQREEQIESSLVDVALNLKDRGISVDQFETEALVSAKQFESLPFGQLHSVGKKSPRIELNPKEEVSPDERAAEGKREAVNVLAVAAVFRRFDELLERESLMTYGDLLSRATSMLRSHPEIAERLRDRWRHAMVDEFQDTNPQQLALLRAIFGEPLKSVMAVGDVRQAIFEWNGADPRGIRMIATAPGTTCYPLSRNRRSPQQVLDAAYHVLPAGTDYRGEPLTAEHGAAPRIVIKHAMFGDGADTDENRAREASAIAAEIEVLIDNGARPSEIVILMRSRTAARVYAGALADRGIFSKTHGGVGFFDAPEIRDAVAWLRLLDDPSDAFALTRILESPVIGVGHGTIAALYGDQKKPCEAVLVDRLPDWMAADELDRLERLRAVLRTLSPMLSVSAPDAVRALIAETALDVAHGHRAPAVARQVRANLSKLVALAVGFTQDRPLARLSDFLDEIDERDLLEIDEPEAELSGDEVSLMTIHAAKGLEWDYVFLANVAPGVFPSGGGSREIVAKYDPLSRALVLRYDVFGRMPLRWLICNEPHDPLTGERYPKPEPHEESRLFYVALTRAKKAIWVSGPFRPKMKPSAFLASVCEFCAELEHAAAFGGAPAPAGEDSLLDVPVAQEAITRILERLSRVPTLFDAPAEKLSSTAISTYDMCPRQARYRYLLRIPDLRDDAVPPPADTEGEPRPSKLDPAMFGNIVHRALELSGQARIENQSFELDDVVDAALFDESRENDAQVRVRVHQAVGHALTTLDCFEPIQVEAEFDTMLDGIHVGGFIDLIARDADGSIVIIDYKTGRVPDEHYALQLALYRLAVAETYPDSRTAILRISELGVALTEPVLPSPDVVRERVRLAATMVDTGPRVGIHCGSCPYSDGLCPEGTREVALALLVAQ